MQHRHIRLAKTCPLCQSAKDTGLVVCWPCYRTSGMREGNPQVEIILSVAEAQLSTRSEVA